MEEIDDVEEDVIDEVEAEDEEEDDDDEVEWVCVLVVNSMAESTVSVISFNKGIVWILSVSISVLIQLNALWMIQKSAHINHKHMDITQARKAKRKK